jgi:hypothetical protein
MLLQTAEIDEYLARLSRKITCGDEVSMDAFGFLASDK